MDTSYDEGSSLKEKLYNMNMTADELQAAAEKSGMDAQFESLVNEEIDETDLTYNEGTFEHTDSPLDSDEEAFKAGIKQTVEETMEKEIENAATVVMEEDLYSGSIPQMTTKKMEESIRNMSEKLNSLSERPKNLKAAKDLVDTWSSIRKIKLTKHKSDMLANVLLTTPGSNTAAFEWILLGWDLRGESNVVEARNINQAMQEFVNQMTAEQKSFKKISTGLITGYKECQTDISKLVETLKTALQSSKSSTTIPIGNKPSKSKETLLEKTVATKDQPTRSSSVIIIDPPQKDDSMMNKIDLLLAGVGKTREEMLAVCPIKILLKVLKRIVASLDDSDWKSLNYAKGRMAMITVIAEEIEVEFSKTVKTPVSEKRGS